MAAKMPFQCMQICNEILFAARGGDILSFDLGNGSHKSTWNNPNEKKETDGKETCLQAENGPNTPTPAPKAASPASTAGQSPAGPPAKRRKLSDAGREGAEAGKDHRAEAGDAKHDESKSKKQKHANANAKVGNAERCIVNAMTMTKTGDRLIALTGQDKTIWVFRHDGSGNLTLLSQRTMPKRPCSIALAQDESTILSADKFGDVYSLPLHPTPAAPAAPAAQSSPQPSAPSPSPATTPATFVPAANALTVHTRGNLRALEQQRLMAQKASAIAMAAGAKPDAPDFEHALLLGHVSLLTAVAVALHAGREYLITADRDEHIRVSRGAPQAHVVETYCLGHGSFVSRLLVPEARPEVLVSGGGDPYLCLWDWRAGKLLGKAELLGLLTPEVGRVAVSGLYSKVVEGECLIYVICERIPLLLTFALQDGSRLVHRSCFKLPGYPLDVVWLQGSDEASQKAIVALDYSSGIGLSTLEANHSGHGAQDISLCWVESPSGEVSPLALQVPPHGDDIPVAELGKLLYTAENLRKRDVDDGRENGE